MSHIHFDHRHHRSTHLTHNDDITLYNLLQYLLWKNKSAGNSRISLILSVCVCGTCKQAMRYIPPRQTSSEEAKKQVRKTSTAVGAAPSPKAITPETHTLGVGNTHITLSYITPIFHMPREYVTERKINLHTHTAKKQQKTCFLTFNSKFSPWNKMIVKIAHSYEKRRAGRHLWREYCQVKWTLGPQFKKGDCNSPQRECNNTREGNLWRRDGLRTGYLLLLISC